SRSQSRTLFLRSNACCSRFGSRMASPSLAAASLSLGLRCSTVSWSSTNEIVAFDLSTGGASIATATLDLVEGNPPLAPPFDVSPASTRRHDPKPGPCVACWWSFAAREWILRRFKLERNAPSHSRRPCLRPPKVSYRSDGRERHGDASKHVAHLEEAR